MAGMIYLTRSSEGRYTGGVELEVTMLGRGYSTEKGVNFHMADDNGG